MYNTGKIKFKEFNDEYGHLTPIEGERDIPFKIKRIYYITDVDEGIRRGFHSHKILHQVLICITGSVKIMLKTPIEERVVELCDSTEGLYIGPMVWREMYDFSFGAVLLVLASNYYDANDYIRDYSKYELEAKKYFGCGEKK